MTPSPANAPGKANRQPPAHAEAGGQPARLHRATSSDPNYLSPEDAIQAPACLPPAYTSQVTSIERRRRERNRDRSARRKARPIWKKLLWVKQSYPDNYTDAATFLDHLQRNPRLQPYEFWPLVADSTVIVQHVASVAVFVCCFVGIFQDRISPVAVVGWGSVATVLGWFLWDRWVAHEDAAAAPADTNEDSDGISAVSSPASSTDHKKSEHPPDRSVRRLGLMMPDSHAGTTRHRGDDKAYRSSAPLPSPTMSSHPTGAERSATYTYYAPYGGSSSLFSAKNQQRIATAKSACLIYGALLGLSPILKSLTKSTSSDSIWAMSTWLMCINIFFFDYGGAVGAKLPASLSTNAALMASTMLASRLPSTNHVFSLTLFSIEVFGLFPIFRRHLRLNSWRGHLLLTLALVASAGGGVGITVSGGGWKAAAVGLVLGCVLTGLGMGVCSWWLIGLQKYKNEIHGPWDPARPVLRRHWDR